MRKMDCARSSFVKKWADAGLSGKKSHTRMPYSTVRPPVMTFSCEVPVSSTAQVLHINPDPRAVTNP